MGKVTKHLIAGSSLLLLLGCGAQRETLRTFPDIQALESQVRNYRDWLQTKEQELSSLKRALEPYLTDYLKSNMYLYDSYNNQLAEMDTAYSIVAALARQQKRAILPLQTGSTRSYNQSFPTITAAFSNTDLKIREQQRVYETARKEIISLFKTRNLQVIFIPEQVHRWKETHLDLRERRTLLQPRYEKLMDLAVRELALGEGTSSARRLGNMLNRAEAYQKDLDRLGALFEQLEKQAIREVGGSVYIRGIGSEPPEYEKGAIRGLEKYRSILTELDQLLPEN